MSEVIEGPGVAAGGFLHRHGQEMILNGYSIVPILPGKKAPGFDGWQKTRSTRSQLTTWLSEGQGRCGVGILTRDTPAIDIDVMDEDLAAKLEAFCQERLGEAPVRIGSPPKRLLMYRTEVPFKKIRSKVYLNEWDERCLVEILGDGQQFVAFHIHPDTGKPYRWTSADSPLTVSTNDLPVIDLNVVEELIELFESEAEARGWKAAKGSRRGPQLAAGAIDRNDPFAADTAPVSMSVAELHQRLMMVPGADDYDIWLNVGMALHHQFEGEDEGRALWHEWSEHDDKYDADALDRKWKSLDITDKGRAPITARYILRLAKEAAESKAAELAVELRDAFAQARTREDWNAAVNLARRAEIDHVTRAAVAGTAKQSIDRITGEKVPLGDVKRSIAFESAGNAEMPRWCRDWVYDVSDDRFFNTTFKHLASPQGFNAMNDRWALTKKDILEGKTQPSSKAGELALNLYKIQTVQGRRYAPGNDPVYMHKGSWYANTYDESSLPPEIKVIRPIDKLNIQRVRRHMEHLLEDEGERQHLLDFLSYVVQNPGKRVNYAILLQGVQGDGKSFFSFLLRAVMGEPNVRMLNAHILESAFTGWAEGQCVAAIEEVRLIGHNRHDTLNRVKPFITNQVIEIHPKGRNPYNCENTTNYLLFTNYRDALPLSENERRYCVLFSKWQSGDALREFKEGNPDYYQELYSALDDSAPALRAWLLRREQSPDFNPEGDAPITNAFRYMVKAAMPAEMQVINDVIDDGEHPDISNTLLNVTKLQQVFMDGEYDGELPSGKSLTKALEIAGFWPLGRVRIGNERFRFYSKSPEQFTSTTVDGQRTIDVSAIKRWVEENCPDESGELDHEL